MAARILDVAGIVLNRNTIPGDKTALFASGIRYGTPWMTQRGLTEKDMVNVADAIADLFQATIPYSVESRKGAVVRAKVDFKVLEEVKLRIRKLSEYAGADLNYQKSGYPHFFYLDDKSESKTVRTAVEMTGEHVDHFVQYCFFFRNQPAENWGKSTILTNNPWASH